MYSETEVLEHYSTRPWRIVFRLKANHNRKCRLFACVAALACGAAEMGQIPGTFTTTGSMIAARFGYSATLLFDGRVLIAGGSKFASAEVYDPSTGTFGATGDMLAARWEHTATLLPGTPV